MRAFHHPPQLVVNEVKADADASVITYTDARARVDNPRCFVGMMPLESARISSGLFGMFDPAGMNTGRKYDNIHVGAAA